MLAAWDGVRNNFGFWPFFARFIAMLYLLEIYDILFFDWVLLCHSGFFPHFYPELKGVVGPHMFGYNKRAHILTSRSIFPPARFLRACACSFSAFRAGIPAESRGGFAMPGRLVRRGVL